MTTKTRSVSYREQPWLPQWRSADQARVERAQLPQLRSIPGLEVRAEGEGDSAIIEGKGAVVGEIITFGGMYWSWDEQIAPGAFDDALSGLPDIRSMFNHDANNLLGRTKAGSLNVWIDQDQDLSYRTKCNPLDPNAMSTFQKVKRGDVDGSSIMFRIVEEVATVPDDSNGLERVLYTITKIAPLYEVGPVVFPAYETTTSEALSANVEAAMRSAGVPDDELPELLKLWQSAPVAAGAQLRSIFEKAPALRAAVCSCPTGDESRSDAIGSDIAQLEIRERYSATKTKHGL